MLFGRRDDVVNRLLDTNIHDVIAVVRQDDVDKVLANVVHVTSHGREHNLALARCLTLFHVWFEKRNRGLHHLGRLQDERELHFTFAKPFAHDLHARKQVVVDDAKSGHALGAPEVEVVFEPLQLTVDDASRQTFTGGQGSKFGSTRITQCGTVHSVKQIEHRAQRVIGEFTVGVVLATIPHQIEGNLAPVIRHGCERHDLRRIHNRGGKSGRRCFVQEDRVQDGARCRVQPERHVRDTQRGLHTGVLRRDLPNRFDGLNRIAARFFLTGRNGERECIDDDVADAHPPVVNQFVNQSARDAHLVFAGAGLTLLVDGQSDNGRAVLLDQRHDAPEARVGAVTVFVVDRVDDRATTDKFKSCLQHGRLGRVDDERQGGCAAKARHNLLHIGHTVAPDVIHAHVKQMRAIARLLARDINAIVPALLEHGVAERF